MRNKIIIIALASGFIMLGCKKFLTVNPETTLASSTFFKTQGDFEQAVNATYAPLRAFYNRNAWVLEETHSDNTHYQRNILFGAVDPEENVADFAVPTANGITTNQNVRDMYRGEYLMISRANQVLATIDNVDFDANSKNNLKGQVLFLRALGYFDLARLFGKVPLHLKPTGSREDAALPLSSEDSVYMQIIADATQAISLLPPKSQQQLGRATKGAAQTLLANVYIQLKRWPDAEPLLKDVIQSNEYSLIPDYNNVFSESNSNKNNAESIFEVQFKEGTDGYSGNFFDSYFLPRPILVNEMQPITGTSNTQPPSSEGNNIPTPDIIGAYEPGDKRLDASIAYVTLSTALQANKTFPYIKKYAKKHDLVNNHGMDWPVYRYAEVLLFYAEVLNEQQKPEAVNYLNQIRNRAGLGNTTATSQVDIRKAIYHERRVELAFENKRWFDLVRTDRIQEVIVPYGQRMIADPETYYFPAGATPPANAFTVLDKFYPLPADESAISPYF